MNEHQVPGYMERVRQARLPGQPHMKMADRKMTGILCKVISASMGGKGKGKGKGKNGGKSKASSKPAAFKFGSGKFY